MPVLLSSVPFSPRTISRSSCIKDTGPSLQCPPNAGGGIGSLQAPIASYEVVAFITAFSPAPFRHMPFVSTVDQS